eukprot:61278-Alexandrium_andersonii.AAC.1
MAIQCILPNGVNLWATGAASGPVREVRDNLATQWGYHPDSVVLATADGRISHSIHARRTSAECCATATGRSSSTHGCATSVAAPAPEPAAP